MRSVHELLLHKSSLLEGLVLRVAGMESRTQNLINLAFNTVNQRDSHALKEDSRAMKIIATMTMIFLPATTVAGIFGSSFFNFDTTARALVTANNFGIFWMITLPLSLTVLISAGMWPSLRAKSSEQRKLRDWLHVHNKIAMPAALFRNMTNFKCVQYINLIMRGNFGNRIWGGGLATWFQTRGVGRQTPSV